ncbi:ligand-binding SRPBCC domain-containing protein [Dyadobacter sp. BE34]|uniref:Ligand-binding SRPBCC domain-containing protein n=1 Tax=Dyadobacter fermentans TaxID=94254 RepID=A0ABU1QYI4_9BACT|nr:MULTISPECIES: SRPBCC family protein [Dyadobacter]MDR6805790.1 ligand-binding SRPBCC domain-containing protein [Dyadobacter fermentans]MDR7042449.1 ligand-binding SRPBCC domain-containing protein [Dyadobacter sp. BE242]MDR7196762.1 ligand-binding SRPBCC domain-containing protein [Dyadobacter sp. BE34]MDR7215804.1 ligand-binding SRPBCC domain-containing protein [Dyadobacter sp. BE31]MDR7263340.1 ligand-binding SRPBCC domain-containing protein [Dyadobacter sp. BE32]
MRELYFKQWMPISLDEAWAFFSNPANLKEITPSQMGFVVTSSHHSGEMYAGQIIRYIVRPLFGIPLKWCTEITHVVDKQYFVDEQRFGPYAFWHHQHRFTEQNGGVLMEDILHYKVPFGILGRLVDRMIVNREVNTIFAYRRKILSERFGA